VARPATTKAARTARPAPPPGVVKISKLAALSGVPASTIKHYVRLGLLPPPVTRPNKQMAYYDPGLVDRIRAIKILQSERYLPLPTIKKILGEPPRPGEQRSEALEAQQLPLLEPALRPPPSGWMARKQLLATFRVGEKDLAAMEAAGLVSPTSGERGEPGYADTDLEILRVVHDARAAGLEQLFPMEILEPYVAAVRHLVQLEIELFRTRVQSGVELPAGLALDEVATLSARLGERLVVALRRQLVLAEVRGSGSGAAGAGDKKAARGTRRPRGRVTKR
jgi:DNA-binding transcriptional MerR regulator